MSVSIDQFLSLLVIGMASGVLSLTISRSSPFEFLRNRLFPDKESFFGELIRCPYCLGHWISLTLIWIYPPLPVSAALLSWLSCTAISALVAGRILYEYE